ncbi:hypothetical protein ABIB94_007159 [Bradyrhizobium sp. JR7.2]|uniref:hypothetical protein n=1 Tax=unclassified Bradyrhizobium TaxID=2631580 RepID=UPI00339AA2EA
MSNESDFDDLYGSKYFSAPDLHGETWLRRIGKVALVELKEKDGSIKRKYLVYFDGVEKALVLNKTNAQKLATAYGKDHSKWIGMEVELYAEMTTLGKEGVRVRPLKPAGTSDLNDKINL